MLAQALEDALNKHQTPIHQGVFLPKTNRAHPYFASEVRCNHVAVTTPGTQGHFVFVFSFDRNFYSDSQKGTQIHTKTRRACASANRRGRPRSILPASVSLQLRVPFFPHPLGLAWPCDLFWPKGWGWKWQCLVIILSPGLERPCTRLFSCGPLRLPWERGRLASWSLRNQREQVEASSPVPARSLQQPSKWLQTLRRPSQDQQTG